MYFKELKIISSKNFSKKIIENVIKTVVPNKKNRKSLNEIYVNYHSIRILFSKKDFIKKFRFFGIVHKMNFNSTNFRSLIFLKDQDIIN